MKNKFQLFVFLFFTLVTCALIFRNIQLSQVPLQDWDESIYARVAYESAKQRHLRMTYNDQLWLEKPPLIVYILSLLMISIGQSEFWLRSISIVFGVLVLICVYNLSRKVANDCFKKDTPYLRLVALLPVCVLLSTPLFLERTTYVDYDMPLALGWVLFFLANSFSLQLTALLIGVLSKSFLGFFPFVFDIFYIRKLNRPVWQWIVLLVIPLIWHVIAFAVYGNTFIQMHIVDHLIKRVTDPIELHFGGRIFYIKELLSQFSIMSIALGLAYGMLFFNAIKEYLKTRLMPAKAVVVLLSPLAYIAFLTFSKTKIPWYIMPTLPLFSLAVIYFFYSIKNKWFQIGLTVFIVGFFLYRFFSYTVFFKPVPDLNDKYKVAICLKKLPQKTVAMLVNEDERKIKNVFEAAHLGISSSFIYGGSPALVYYSGKKVTFFYDTTDFKKNVAKYPLAIVSKADASVLTGVQSLPVCSTDTWSGVTISK